MKEELWTGRYIGMSLSSFFQYLIHYTLLATLPIYVIQALKQDEYQAGLVLTFFQIGAVLFRPFAGKWIDEFNKKKVLFSTLGVSCLVCCFYIGVQGIFFLFLLRFFHGASFSTGTTATATMAALFSPVSRKGEGIGYFSVFTSIAMVFGPFIGLSFISLYSFDVLFVLCAVFSILAFFCGNMPQVKQDHLEVHPKKKSFFAWKNLIELQALPIALAGLCLSFVYSGLLTFLPLYAKSLGMLEAASYFFAVYAAVIVLSRPLIGKLFDSWGADPVVYISIAIYFVGMISLSQVTTFEQFLIAGAVIGLGFGGLNPSFQTLAVLVAPPKNSGLATSTYLLSMDIGVGIGSFLLGIVVAYGDYRSMYLFCSGMVLVIAFIYYFFYQRCRANRSYR